MKMICVIRIRGQVGINKDVKETLDRLMLRKKYSCIVINPTKEQFGMIKKIRNFVAFGEIKKDVLEKLIEKRGQLINKEKKIDAKKAVEELEEGKKYEKLNLKSFFRLHPPRKGIKSKLHFPKGVLGNNKEKINELVKRML
jgi:large subunit ribosomal protein L30